jgi:purine-binding chemotaxis protein CheW
VRNVRQSVAQVQLVTFRLGQEEFGLDVFTVQKILRHEPVTPVPRAPRFVEGVLDVRGEVIPVLDLRKRFELPRTDTDEDTRIVLVDFQGEPLGLVVDAVMEVLRVPETMLAPPPRYFKGLAQEFIRGIVRMDQRLVVLIDLEQVLSSDERIALHEIDFAAARADAAAASAEAASAPSGDAPAAAETEADASPSPDATGTAGETEAVAAPSGEAEAVEVASVEADASPSPEATAEAAQEGGGDAGGGKPAGRGKRGGKRA